MAYMDFRPYRSPLGGAWEVRHAPMNASEVFEGGELVYINTDGEVQTFPKDDTEALVADIGAGALQCGVAAFGPGAAANAAVPTNRIWSNPITGEAYATGAQIAYYPADRGIQFITRNTAAAGGAAAGVAPNGADRGVAFFISYIVTPTPDGGWAIEQSAATLGTQVAACIVDVLDAQGNPVGATADGTFYVFEIKTAA